MYSWLVARLVRRTFERLSAGDPSAVLAVFGDGTRLVFPGRNSWAIDSTDRAEIEAWFRRLEHDVLRQFLEDRELLFNVFSFKTVEDSETGGEPWGAMTAKIPSCSTSFLVLATASWGR